MNEEYNPRGECAHFLKDRTPRSLNLPRGTGEKNTVKTDY